MTGIGSRSPGSSVRPDKVHWDAQQNQAKPYSTPARIGANLIKGHACRCKDEERRNERISWSLESRPIVTAPAQHKYPRREHSEEQPFRVHHAHKELPVTVG